MLAEYLCRRLFTRDELWLFPEKIYLCAAKEKDFATARMINRALLRVKVVQTLYSHYKGGGRSLLEAQKGLSFNLNKTYDLYFHLLQLSVEVTRCAERRIEVRRNKLRPTDDDLRPNTRFSDNAFVRQLEINEHLIGHLSAQKLSWVNYPDLIKSLLKQIESADFFAEYMGASTSGYEADKEVWRKIYRRVFPESDDLEEAIEEQSIYWVGGMEIIYSFIDKTIKRFDRSAGASQALIPMYRDESDRLFGEKLLAAAIANEEDYRRLIDENTHNWELDRIAFMDIVIMQVALAELCHFPTIPVNVTLNEYIELSKQFSTEKSGTFVNGVLDKIVSRLKADNKLTKVVSFEIK